MIAVKLEKELNKHVQELVEDIVLGTYYKDVWAMKNDFEPSSSSWDDFERNSQTICGVINGVTHLMKNCLRKFNKHQLAEVKERHDLLVEQQKFWLSQNNYNRFSYDLIGFSDWLLNYIAFVEESSWHCSSHALSLGHD